jgi:aldehyde dehydrogenase (NAD+)
VADAVREALGSGGGIVAGEWEPEEGAVRGGLVLESVPEPSRLWREDHFSPVALWREVEDEAESLRRDEACPFALGASVFGRDLRRAEAFAARVSAPVVTINDAVVPTADPRLGFGGRKRSGFGVTRGAEGLRAMTVAKEMACRPARGWLPHLDAPAAGDAERFRELLNLLHGRGMVARTGSLWRLIRSGTKSAPAASVGDRQQNVTKA